MRKKTNNHVRRERKKLAFFKDNYNLQPPFKVVPDDTFLEYLKSDMGFKTLASAEKFLTEFFGQETTLSVTKCISEKVYDGVKSLMCDHADKRSSAECIVRMTRGGNIFKFIIATASPDAAAGYQQTPATPVLFGDVKRGLSMLKRTDQQAQFAEDVPNHVPPTLKKNRVKNMYQLKKVGRGLEEDSD